MKLKWIFILVSVSIPFSVLHSQEAGDPDPVAELRRLDFFRAGKGMHLTPGILERLEDFRKLIEGTRLDEKVLDALARRWGLQSVDGELVGLKNVDYRGQRTGVLGCVACHSGKAAGQYIVGIGNKNIDPGQIGIDGLAIESESKKISDLISGVRGIPKNPDFVELENRSIRLMRKLANPSLSAQTQGLVPVSLVGSWFFEQAKLPLPTNGTKGATKVPSWFGFGEKLKVGQFADAIGAGHPPGWIIGVEITAGQTPEVVREYLSDIETAAKWISALKPPAYPFSLSRVKATRGEQVFLAECAGCHGTYDRNAQGEPRYKEPRVVPWEKVMTDADRLNYVTEEFLGVVRSSPLSDLIQLSPYAGKRMYVAPRLHGIWARFPYLHNASVPTLRDLLEPVKNRPRFFSLQNAGERERFDPIRVGLTRTSDDRARKAKPVFGGRNRAIFDTRLLGQSNVGHEKGVDLTPEEKDDLVEYLKSL
jgi:hypothetical protein